MREIASASAVLVLIAEGSSPRSAACSGRDAIRSVRNARHGSAGGMASRFDKIAKGGSREVVVGCGLGERKVESQGWTL